jgi:hypothetical protein
VDIAIENLPPYEQISNQSVRGAVAELDQAKVAAEEAKKSRVQLELELPAAQDADAAEDERLRSGSGGKEKLKGRPATQRHEKAISDAEHEERVARLAYERAEQNVVAALDEHGDEWGNEVAAAVDALTEQWTIGVNELIALHGQLGAALTEARIVLGDERTGAAITFDARQVQGREWASGQSSQVRPAVSVVDVLTALADVAMPPEPAENAPQQHLPPGAQPHGGDSARGEAGVAAEEAERRAFLERAATPEAAEARRQRAEQHRQANDEALQATLEG